MLRLIMMRSLWWLLVLIACGVTFEATRSYLRGDAAEWDPHHGDSGSHFRYVVASEAGRFYFVRLTGSSQDTAFSVRSFTVSKSDEDLLTGEGTFGFLGFRYAKLGRLAPMLEAIAVPA